MSSKKQFDHIEEKIKEAADHYQPAFDAAAWKAMEAKLDGDKRRRKPIFWWFVLPLILAGALGIYYLVDKNEARHKQDIAITKRADNNTNSLNKKEVANRKVADISTQPFEKNAVNKSDVDNPTDKLVVGSEIKHVNIVGANNNSSGIASISSTKPNRIAVHNKGKMNASNSGGGVGIIENTSQDEIVQKENTGTRNRVFPTENSNVESKDDSLLSELKTPVAQLNNKEKKEQTEATKKDTTNEVKPVATVKKAIDKSKKSHGFYVQASAGADAGSTKLLAFENSTATAKYGIGVGYKFSKRLSVQTGFYSNLKKYAAKPGDYKIKPGSPMSTYQMDGIKATCLIYEIPLAVKYDVISKASIIFYATGGVSSYIMQKERYDCSYTYYNNSYETDWLYKGNKHLFSTAVFSVGVEKKLSPRFWLLLEPSISLPLTGVGDGKMKIYSAAVQGGLKYYLFKK